MINLLPPHHPYAHRRVSQKKYPLRRPWWAWVLVIGGTGVALYVVAAAAVVFAVRWHVTDTTGTIDQHAEEFQELAAEIDASNLQLPDIPTVDEITQRVENVRMQCRLDIVRRASPQNGVLINTQVESGAELPVITKMLFAAALRLPEGSPAIEAFRLCNTQFEPTITPTSDNNLSLFAWANKEEWATVRDAFRKDRQTIYEVGQATGVPARLIVSVAMVEQLRLYFTERELFEKFFRPLKILGNATQFAWGVMAIKEKTAVTVEEYAASPKSAFYPGPGMEQLLALPKESPDKVRFQRLTDEKNHRYSYLYGAIELKELMAQWRQAGFPIDNRPEILATLFNVGFARSRPSDHPVVGGSTLTIADTQYTFGGLAFEFYYSGEMAEEFPLPPEVVAE